MKKICTFFIALCCIVSFLHVPATATEEAQPAAETTVYSGCTTLDASQSLLGAERLVTNAGSVILYETTSQTLMYAWNADEKVDPASLVKIMTGYIVADRGVMTDAVTVRQEVLDSVSIEAATIGLMADEVLTVEQLLNCMLVSSANDAAAVLADYISGGQVAFVELMNSYAKELGCTQTQFTNAHGLYDANQYSTARDLARILDAAMKNDVFRTVFGTVYYTIPATNKSPVRELVSGNFHMCTDDVKGYYDDRVIGGRTGITDAGERNLATVAQNHNMELLCILLGAESELAENSNYVVVYGGYRETSSVLDKGFHGLQLTQVIREDQVITQQSVLNGECDVVLGPVDSVFAIMPDTLTMDDLTLKVSAGAAISAPIQKGEIVSEVEIWYNNLCVATTQLYAMNSVDVLQTQVTEQDTQNNSGGWPDIWTILIVIVAVALVVVILRIAGSTRRRRSANRSRQYRKDRRRSR